MPTRTRQAVAAALAVLAGVLLAAGQAARASGAASGWSWPLDPRPRVVAGFDPPAGPYTAGHRGVDLAAVAGQRVRAAGAGVVSYAGPVAGRGVVSVAHPDGRRTTYEPVTASVSPGVVVDAGDALGRVSAAPGHCLPATCLHWGLREGEAYLDPLGLLGATPVRLLPLWADDVPPTGWRGFEPVVPTPGHDRGPLMAGLVSPR